MGGARSSIPATRGNFIPDRKGSPMPAGQESSNKATVRRFHDAMTGGAERVSQTIDEVVAPDVLFHAPVPTGATGAQALKQVMTILYRAYPDLHVAVEDLIAEGDKVVGRNTVHAMQSGIVYGYVGLVDGLVDRRTISEAAWAMARSHFDEAEMIEAIALVGYYHTISFLCRGLDLPLEDYATRFPRA